MVLLKLCPAGYPVVAGPGQPQASKFDHTFDDEQTPDGGAVDVDDDRVVDVGVDEWLLDVDDLVVDVVGTLVDGWLLAVGELVAEVLDDERVLEVFVDGDAMVEVLEVADAVDGDEVRVRCQLGGNLRAGTVLNEGSGVLVSAGRLRCVPASGGLCALLRVSWGPATSTPADNGAAASACG
jgi:hypothetical protein